MPEFLNGSWDSPENKGFFDIIYVKYVFYNVEDFSYSNVCILQRVWQFKGTVNDDSPAGYDNKNSSASHIGELLKRKEKDMGQTKDLLHGNIRKELIALMLPLIVGNILQQFYNTIDAMIIGHYVGSTAFAAVGVAGSVMNLFIFIINGGCNGMSVVFAELYGQRKWEKLRKEIFLSLLLGGGMAVFLSLVSTAALAGVLRILGTPADVTVYARRYLVIILLGLPVTFLYNWCAAALQAAGDTRTPLYTLMIAMCLNTALDLLFVAGFHRGTEGTAAATVIAQGLASAICLCIMRKKHMEYSFDRSDIGYDRFLIKRTARFGLVSALHQSSLYIGKLLVQGAVNTGGTDMIAAYTATMRIEGFANSFSDSGAAAISVFTAQNHGTGNKERCKAGFWKGLTVMLPLAVVLSVLMAVVTQKAVILLMGNPSAAVLQNADDYMLIISLVYVFCFTGSTFVGYFRGIGRVEVPVIGAILQISIRVILSYLWISRWGLKAVAMATGTGWMAIVLYQITVYRRIRYKIP